MALKPQDLYVAVKIAADGARRTPYAQLATELVMSPSEVHASVKRAETSGLLHGKALFNRANLSALEEFLIHGLRYAFPPERGQLTRGVATSYGAEPLRSILTASSDPLPVWPYEQGSDRGIAFSPLYKTAPIAALRDNRFYECLALVDALRDGRIRERKIAQEELLGRLSLSSHAALQH